MRERFIDALLTGAGRTLLLRDRLLGHMKRRLDSFCFEKERLVIESSGRRLTGVFVPAREDAPAVLLCHGIGERVEYWSQVQLQLYEAGISSLVFSYTGFGTSRGRGGVRRCEEDAVMAFATLKATCSGPVFLLGYSMGSAVAAVIASRVDADGLILCEGFTSLLEAAMATGVPGRLVRIADGIWQTTERLERIKIPVLVVHSDSDRLFPLWMGEELVKACGQAGEMRVVQGLNHNDPIFQASQEYWDVVVEWVKRQSRPKTGVE